MHDRQVFREAALNVMKAAQKLVGAVFAPGPDGAGANAALRI